MPSSSARPRRKRRGQYHHGDLRQALVDQAVRTIADGNVDALTLRSVGAALGVSRTALYRHFADKAALLATVATDGFRRLTEDTARAWKTGGGGRAGFEAMGLAYVHFAVRNPAHYRVMFGPFVEARSTYPDLEAAGAAAFQVLVDALVSLQRDRVFRKDDPALLGRYVWATVHGVAMLAIDGRLGNQSAIDALAQLAVTRIQSGLAPSRSRARMPS